MEFLMSWWINERHFFLHYPHASDDWINLCSCSSQTAAVTYTICTISDLDENSQSAPSPPSIWVLLLKTKNKGQCFDLLWAHFMIFNCAFHMYEERNDDQHALCTTLVKKVSGFTTAGRRVQSSCGIHRLQPTFAKFLALSNFLFSQIKNLTLTSKPWKKIVRIILTFL